MKVRSRHISLCVEKVDIGEPTLRSIVLTKHIWVNGHIGSWQFANFVRVLPGPVLGSHGR